MRSADRRVDASEGLLRVMSHYNFRNPCEPHFSVDRAYSIVASEKQSEHRFFQAGCCEGLSTGEVESVSASIFVNKSLAPARKSRKVGALDLSSNASSSGVASETSAGLSSLAIILFFAS